MNKNTSKYTLKKINYLNVFLIIQIFLSNVFIRPLKSFYIRESHQKDSIAKKIKRNNIIHDSPYQILLGELEWKPKKQKEKENILNWTQYKEDDEIDFFKENILNWTQYKEGDEIDFLKENIYKNFNESKKDKTLNSLNRSIIFDNEIIGPDIGWLVPPGLQWNNKYRFDFSVRGYSRRSLKDGDPFLGWNGGDAVGQFYYQSFFNEEYSFGLNFGARSVYEGDAVGGGTAVGEGLSMGFRLDRKLSNSSGIAFGAEQLLHFDGLTDTGRDIYLTLTKGWWKNNNEGNFPLKIATFGFGTGKLAEGNIKGLCSNILGGSGTEINHQRPLCWAPIFTLARVHNRKLSTFFEYNSKWFLLGTSIAPYKKIPFRGTFAVQLSDHNDNYKLNNFKEAKWIFRLSLGL